jgi:hypothetical protein
MKEDQMGSTHGKEHECENLVVEPEEIRSLRRPKRRWEDSTEMNVEK